MNGSSIYSKLPTNSSFFIMPSKMHNPLYPRLFIPAQTWTQIVYLQLILVQASLVPHAQINFTSVLDDTFCT